MRRIAIIAVVLLFVSCGDGAKPDPWHADEGQLLGRVERLAGNGDVEAAGGVLGELEKRGSSTSLDRGRVALARGLLAAGREDEALKRVREVAWADKGPAIAGELVGLELAIRWRGLLDNAGGLRSGRLSARDDVDSDNGRPGGRWESRSVAFHAIAAVLAGPARMVEIEGGTVPLPAEPGLLALARYAHGATSWTDTTAALGESRRWSPAVALAAVQLHLMEFDPELALAAAEVLWTSHAQAAESAAAYRELRLWQLRRRTALFLRLWSYPAIDARLDLLAAQYPEAATTAAAAIAAEADLGGASMALTLRETVRPMAMRALPELDLDTISLDATPDEDPATPDERPMQWRLATSYDGFALEVGSGTVADGDPLPLTVTADSHGPYHLALWRITDPAAWKRLCLAPARADLPATPVWEATLAAAGPCTAPAQPEGRYIVTATARACPVVAMRSLRVASTALHLDAGSEAIVAWTVDRRQGRARPGLAMAASIELARSAERAAGAAWAPAEPAWRSGFREGFTSTSDLAWRGAGQETAFATGKAAGTTAATVDPPYIAELSGTTGADGIWNIALPSRLVGRSWTATVRVATPGIEETSQVSWGAEAQWTAKAVAWADKPFVRPGETLRFAALLRDHDGDRYRLPVGRIAARIECAGEVLWSGELVISACGLVTGETVLPPGCKPGDATLILGDGPRHHLARCERLTPPPLTITVVESGIASLRAGEPHPIRIRLRDAAGEPIAGQEVSCQAYLLNGPGGPSEPLNQTTDLAGEALFTVPTPDSAEGVFLATIKLQRDHHRWMVHHEWTVSRFPFPLQIEVPERETEVGGQIRVHLALPDGAQVQLQQIRSGTRAGTLITATGTSTGRVEVLLPIDAVGEAIEVFCPVLGGGEAVRRIAVTVRPRPTAGEGEAVACLPERTRVKPGEELAIGVACAPSGRDALLVVAARNPLAMRSVTVSQTAARSVLTVTPEWGPSCHVQALAWLPGRGFVASRRSEIEVLPVDKLLAVEITLPHDDWRPGERVDASVAVRDWRGNPVVGAALTLGVVDERLYALAEDATPDLLDYFHHGHRAWQLLEGRSIELGSVRAELWRAVMRRWQPVDGEADSLSSYGGGRMRAMGGGGGRSMASDRAEEIRSLGGEADPCIAWVAGATTGADGTIPVSFILPAQAAAFRLTARAADASAAVLVGKVQTRIVARRGLGLHLTAPAVLRPGDQVQVLAELANHQGAERNLRLRWAGSEREVTVSARSRRSLPLELTVPEAPAEAPVVMLGELLGHRLRLEAGLADGAEMISADADILLAAPGLPENRSLRLIADAAGRLILPDVVPAGALVRVAVRAWPDAAARRASELALWRKGNDLRAAAAWLAAPEGRERRDRLTRLWPGLGDSAAATALRLSAARHGEIGVSVTTVPEGLIGDWLLARGRASGLGLPQPHQRGVAGTTRVDRAAAAACALAEGWSEGVVRWHQLRRELADCDDAQALAIALDAARLAGDAKAASELAAQLAQLPWDDELVAVLAADLIPDAAVIRPAMIAIGGATEAVSLDGSIGAEWLGALRSPLAITAPPGALVALDLRWQAPPTVAAGDAEAPRLELWQKDQDGYRVLPPGTAAWPGRPLLLVLDARHCQEHWTIRTTLPSLLRPDRGVASAKLLQADSFAYPLPEVDASRLRGLINAWERAEPGIAATARKNVLNDLASTLARCPAVPDNAGQTCEVRGSDSGITSDVIELSTGSLTAIALAGVGEGSCAWPLTVAKASDGQTRRLAVADLRISVGEPVVIPVTVGHPAAKIILDLAENLDAKELRWLIEQPGDADWSYRLNVLDRQATHDLDTLLSHPHACKTGHWTVAAVRRHLDAEPAFDTPDPMLQQLSPVLDNLIRTALSSRNDRNRAWAALPVPQSPPTRQPATIRAWYERLSGQGDWPKTPFKEWIWEETLPTEELEKLGYNCSLDGWASFLRHDLGIPVRLGAGIALGGDNPFSSSAEDKLGFATLAVAGLAMVALPDGGYELRRMQPDLRALPSPLSFSFEDRGASEALAVVNELLLNRGLPGLRFADGLDPASLPPITLKIKNMAWDQAVGWLAKIWGLQLNGRVLGR